MGAENWRLHHVGVRVKDVDKVAKYYESIGIGPFLSREETQTPGWTFENGYHAVTKPGGFGKRGLWIGSIRLELMQFPFDEDSETPEEGIVHLGFRVDDLEAETAELVKKGVPVCNTGKIGDKIMTRFFDLRKEGGNFMVELGQARPGDKV